MYCGQPTPSTGDILKGEWLIDSRVWCAALSVHWTSFSREAYRETEVGESRKVLIPWEKEEALNREVKNLKA